MKYRAVVILSLLILSSLKQGIALTPPSPAPDPSPIFVPDGFAIFSSEKNESRIKDLRILTKDRYQIQIGAFKRKLYAEIMVSKLKPSLGENITILEEDGFFKVRVTSLKQDKKQDHLAIAGTGNNVAPSRDTLLPPADSVTISPDKPITIARADSLADTIQIFATSRDTAVTMMVQTRRAIDRYFPLKGDSPWFKRIHYFGKSYSLVNALIITIFLSIFTMIILLIVILLHRNKMEREERLRQYLSETYQGMIVDYLFSDSNTDKFFEIASTGYRRQVLIDQMIDVSVNLKGDSEKKLQNLYLALGLEKDSIKRAHDVRWHKKIKGFRELAFMNIKVANSSIYKALNSGNEILRMEAQIALVRLTDHEPFGFLSNLRRPFSLWEQITLHDLIIQHELPVPSFSKWLNSSNPTVVMFALRMIREFRQKNAEDEVREILEHPAAEVRRLAVQVAGDLDMRSTLDTMKRMYKSQDYNTCLEIVKSMGKMPDPTLIGFLQLVLDKEDDVQLQIEATKAIENNGEEGVKTLVKLMKSEYKNYNIIVRHVLDRRIY